jgi:hypothetical protein
VSPVKYEMGFYIPEDDILHSHRRENLKSYINCVWGLNCSSFSKGTVKIVGILSKTTGINNSCAFCGWPNVGPTAVVEWCKAVAFNTFFCVAPNEISL